MEPARQGTLLLTLFLIVQVVVSFPVAQHVHEDGTQHLHPHAVCPLVDKVVNNETPRKPDDPQQIIFDTLEESQKDHEHVHDHDHGHDGPG